MNRDEKLHSIVARICKEMNVYLVDIEIKGDIRKPYYYVYVDNEKGITLGDCEKIVRVIQDEIDFEEEYQGYRLEVSSPGLDRPLVEDYQFRKNLNKNLSLKIKDDDFERIVNGKLTSIDESKIILEDKKGKKQQYERKDIIEAKVKLQW